MKQYLISLAGAIILMSCTNPDKGSQRKSDQLNNNQKSKVMETKNLDTATFGGGCFWCVEAVYQQLNGVVSVASGYSGGPRANPSYEQVCSGATGHAEVVQIVYDTTKISFDELLQVFWTVHDPTTLNRQGADVGTQYRSVVFYHNEHQKEFTKSYIEKLNAEHAYDNPVVTEVSPFTVFYKAEDYHQNYYNDNKNQPYCSFVIQPKVEKFKKVFGDKLKK
jgi:methionine-S-sulfoxide reductase